MASNQKIRILILGGTKFIGKTLVRKLSRKDFNIDVISRNKNNVKNIDKFYNFEIKKIKNYNFNKKYDYVIDFISSEKKILKDVLNKINFKKYIFISTVWLAKLNSKVKLDRPVNSNLTFKNNINILTKKYLLNKYNLEKFICSESKYFPNKLYILRLPIILGNEDKTERLNFYFDKVKEINNQILIKNKKINLNLLWVNDICHSLIKLIKYDLLPKNMFIEALNPKTISYKIFLKEIAKKVHKRKLSFRSFKCSFLTKNFFNLFVYDPFINEIDLKLTKNNIFKLTNYKPKTLKEFIRKIDVTKKKNIKFNIFKSDHDKFIKDNLK